MMGARTCDLDDVCCGPTCDAVVLVDVFGLEDGYILVMLVD